VLWWTTLRPNEAETVGKRAVDDRLPVELWLRTAVESARVLHELATMIGRTEATLVKELDRQACVTGTASNSTELASTPGSLDRYADQLQRGENPAAIHGDVVLRLSQEMASTWRRAAIAAGTPVPAWIGRQIERAPRQCVTWEIAAARSGRTLAEWAYASALSSMTSSSA
jgi:hypothetical protein